MRLASAIASSGAGDAGDRGDRAEGLLVERRHARGHVVEHRRRVEEPGPVGGLSAQQQGSARVDAPADLVVQRLAQVRARQRADACRSRAPTRRAGGELPRRTRRRRLSSTMNRLALTQLWPPLTKRALTAVAAAAGDVGVGQHDERVGAAQLQDLLLQRRPGLRGDDRADLRRAGEGDRRDPVVRDEPGDRAGFHEQHLDQAPRARRRRARRPRWPARTAARCPRA